MQKKRSKAPSRPTEGLVIRQENSGGLSRWIIILLLPITMAAGALAYRLFMDNNELQHQLEVIPDLRNSQRQLSDALTTERLRGDALEKQLVNAKKSAEADKVRVSELQTALESQPSPTFEASLRPGGIALDEITITPGEGASFSIALRVSRQMLGDGLPQSSDAQLGHLAVKPGRQLDGNVRLVVVPKEEDNGKRVYLPQKSWRRSEGFQYSLKPGETASFSGKIELPEGFTAGNARIEVFVTEKSGGYTLLRRVMPWPGSG